MSISIFGRRSRVCFTIFLPELAKIFQFYGLLFSPHTQFRIGLYSLCYFSVFCVCVCVCFVRNILFLSVITFLHSSYFSPYLVFGFLRHFRKKKPAQTQKQFQFLIVRVLFCSPSRPCAGQEFLLFGHNSGYYTYKVPWNFAGKIQITLEMSLLF